MRGVQKGPKGIVHLEEMSLPGPRPLNSRTKKHSPLPWRSLPSRVGVGGRGREDGAARTGAGAGSQWREHPLRALPQAQLQGAAGLHPRRGGPGGKGERGPGVEGWNWH